MNNQKIIYGLSNWKDLKCNDNLICIDSDNFYGDKPNDFIKKYSMPYNKPTLKFVILCDTEEICNDIEIILNCELEKYETDKMNWYNNFDINCIKNILENEVFNNYHASFEGDDMLVDFEEHEYKKYKEERDRFKEKMFWKKKDNMTFDDIIKKYGNPKYTDKYEKYYKEGLEYHKTLKKIYVSQEQLTNELKLGLYKIIQKDNE